MKRSRRNQTTHPLRWAALTAAGVVGALIGASPAHVAAGSDGCPAVGDDILFASCTGEARARLLFLPQDLGALDAPPNTTRRLLITGAYSSGDRQGVEGLNIRRGEALHPYPQGWDGMLLIDAQGDLSIQRTEAVAFDGARYNLRDKTERTAFLKAARKAQLSAVQSHLLIDGGRLDVSEIENAPKFRRRILFTDAQGNYAVYDSRSRALTLFEAAKDLAQRHAPRMALNLDMGSYDFCEIAESGAAQSCGRLSRAEIGKLTNVIELTLR